MIDDAAHASDYVIDGKRFLFAVVVGCSHQMTNDDGSRWFPLFVRASNGSLVRVISVVLPERDGEIEYA